MAKLIIYVTGRPLIYGHKRREFVWSEAHKLYLYEGREFTEQEFNAIQDKVLTSNADIYPRVKVSTLSPPEDISDVVLPRAISANEAEEILLRTAPERLKKKPGHKPIEAVA
jgi:hypothetical protein